MNHVEALARMAQFPARDPLAALGASLALINADFPELLLPAAQKLSADYPTSAQAHQLLGLAARACGDSLTAYEAFRAAARLAPRDALISHSHARTALEAGLPSAGLFADAAVLAPHDGGVLLGQTAALLHEGRPQEGIALLEQTLSANPLWIEGHRSLAGLSGQMGQDALASLASALSTNPRAPGLHHVAISVALQARDLTRAEAAMAEARAALGAPDWLVLLAGHLASEAGALRTADGHFAAAGKPADANAAWMHARHRLRRNQPQEAAALLEPLLSEPGAQAL